MTLPQAGHGFPTASSVATASLSMSSISQAVRECNESAQLAHESDYFGMAFSLPVLLNRSNSAFISPHKPSLRDGAGSISSFTSVSTVVSSHLGSFTAQDFSQSTETLVGDQIDEKVKALGYNRNVLQLSLNMPRRGTQPSLLRSANCQRVDSELLFARPDISRKAPHSSTGTHFELSKNYPLSSDEAGLHHSSPDQVRSGSVPLLRKQATAPSFPPIHEMSFLNNLKIDQVRRTSYVAPQTNFRDLILALSPCISYMSAESVANLILDARTNPETNLKNVLAIDIRPLTDYVKSHLTGAINVCLPLTLLKRPNFNFKKCINSLPEYENLIFKNYLHYSSTNQKKNLECSENNYGGKYGLPALIVYDNVNNSLNLLFMCKKLLDYSCWDAASAPTIILVDGTFDLLALQYPTALTSGKSDLIDLNLLTIKANCDELPKTPCDLSPQEPTFVKAIRSQSTPGFPTNQSSGCPISAISNFFLPKNLPTKTFRIRHNEEVFNTLKEQCAEDDLAAITLNVAETSLLPEWLALSISDKTKIRADFNRLENRERERLNHAFSSHKGAVLEETGELVPSISSGLDYGHKNRYKDIFLFEHSRVKLESSSNATEADSELDYINASYLHSKENLSHFINGDRSQMDRLAQESKYLATQGPMRQTAGDFWRCIVEQKSLLIISLTAEFENGSEKCYPYWREGFYRSGHHELCVKLVLQQQMGPISHRVYDVILNDQKPHRVTQLHHESWKDMSVDVDIDDILLLVAMKKRVLNECSQLPDAPTVVHCSAGCGRTGVFCIVDVLINLVERNNGHELCRDPIFELVDSYRRQRVLMVQTVRQYGFLYRIMVRYVLGQKRCENYLNHSYV